MGDSVDNTQRRPLCAELQATLNVIPAYTYYADPSGALTFVNERLADYLGLPKDHPLRSGIATGAAWDSHLHFVHPDEHEEARKVWSTCLRTGRAGDFSFRVRNAEGKYRWFLSRAEPVRARARRGTSPARALAARASACSTSASTRGRLGRRFLQARRHQVPSARQVR